MLKRFFVMLCLLWIVGLVSAQDEFTESYTFVDGTVVNFPSDFLVIYEDYDEMDLANSVTEIQFYIMYERTILSQELNSLPEILDWWWGSGEGYDPGDEDPIIIGERDGIQTSYTNNDDVDVLVIALPVGDNGSVAIISVLPNIANGVEELQDEGIIFSILETLHYEDLGATFDTILGNSFTFDDIWMIEYPDPWLANTIDQSLELDEVTITVSVYSEAEIDVLELKADPIELLYYDLFAPVDESIVFDPENISFINIRGLEGIRYAVRDTVDEEAIQRVYFLAALTDTDVLAMEITAPVGANILQDSDVQDMIQTIRLDGTLPPIEMMALDSAFNLEGVGEIRFPSYWLATQNENNTVTLSTLDTSIFIVPFTAETAIENGYPDDLVVALLDIVSPLDDSVIINPDDVETGSLQNGNRFAQTTYIETTDSRSYPRTVMVILLDDDSMVFVGFLPQPGINEVSGAALSEVVAILNTIAP